jgi:hypothetical protein
MPGVYGEPEHAAGRSLLTFRVFEVRDEEGAALCSGYGGCCSACAIARCWSAWRSMSTPGRWSPTSARNGHAPDAAASAGRVGPHEDAGDGRRRWRSLDLGTVQVWLEAAAPRVRCRDQVIGDQTPVRRLLS